MTWCALAGRDGAAFTGRPDADIFTDAPGTCGAGWFTNVLTVCDESVLADGDADVLSIGSGDVPTVCDVTVSAAGCDDVPSSAG